MKAFNLFANYYLGDEIEKNNILWEIQSVFSGRKTLEEVLDVMKNLAKDNFDNGAETFIDVILADIDYDTIKKAVRDGSIVNFEGSVIKNHAFTSCGISKGAGFGGQVDYVIKCPAGTKMVYAEPQSHYGNTISGKQMYTPGMSFYSVGGEAEMILQRGTSFRIDKITKIGGSYKIEMTVIDQNYN